MRHTYFYGILGLVFRINYLIFLKQKKMFKYGEVAPKEGIFQIKSPSTSIVERYQ